MAVNGNPTVRRRRLGAELRRLRLASGLTSTQVAERLLISQPKISHLENGRRAIKPRDVRDLCGLYGVTDQQVIDSLMRMASESDRQGWWVAFGEVPYAVFIGLETEASSIRTYEPLVIPGLMQTPAYAAAVIAETIPQATPEQIATRLEVRLRRQHRFHHPARPLSLWVVLDESALRRVVGSPAIMREQLEHLSSLSTQPYITVQVLPHGVGAHPGISGQFSLLHFTDAPGAGTVYLERFTSDLYLEKRSDVERYSGMYEHLQAQALDPDSTRQFITRATEIHTG
ncbi:MULTISPECIES: helix-turn-helix transcriptional regulator [unclassified Streptomyces]|uniref:helix-turn-helix domain-containing protein n=1 Tax=unclassified Streptomyces TaxID=2593676 RepID=UPI000DC7B6D7|nr:MULTISPECIES: helix-turn-helix transcriptional regulator [unclassified Streptomyces]AWZ05228.1 transcriptional regulator [Streptomyces sp. ICC4]AWZ12711.1 transcriptional regulator [Streptomyces sp. ICC1]